nr:immunoglobulin heavy chain junction region [Mus musculus]
CTRDQGSSYPWYFDVW